MHRLVQLRTVVNAGVSVLFLAGLLVIARGQQAGSGPAKPGSLALPEEKHLRNVRQLTFGGQNAEAYFSADDRQLIFQHQGAGVPCDQIYSIAVDAADGKAAVAKL